MPLPSLGRIVAPTAPAETTVAASPALLVDDIVDSRWTLTAVGIQLREAGSGPVYPFALARSVSD